jgi:probable 2-oxoglutarate dehydrogenase E1 component DHKTD1
LALRFCFIKNALSLSLLIFQTAEEREWFAQRIEDSTDTFPKEKRIEMARVMLHSQAWDKFLSVKYPTVKRYCGEGAESLLVFFSSLFELTTAGKLPIPLVTYSSSVH